MINAHKVETVLIEDGTLTLQGLPFQAEELVEVIILRQSKNKENIITTEIAEKNLYPLQGQQPYRYDEPFEPAVLSEDWEVLK